MPKGNRTHIRKTKRGAILHESRVAIPAPEGDPDLERPLSDVERGIVREYVRTGNLATSWERVVGPDKYASMRARKTLRRPTVRRHLARLMDQVGLDDAKLVSVLKQQMEAEEVRHFAHKGKVKDERKVAALDVRQRALELAFRIKGHIRGGYREDDNWLEDAERLGIDGHAIYEKFMAEFMAEFDQLEQRAQVEGTATVRELSDGSE